MRHRGVTVETDAKAALVYKIKLNVNYYRKIKVTLFAYALAVTAGHVAVRM